MEETQSLQDVQRFFMIMSPYSRSDAAPHRLLVIGKKRLPNPERHERFFGFVLATAQKVEDLMKDFGPKDYQRSTRGQRSVEAVRALGEGVYSIVDHGRHTHLAYELEIPKEPGDVQKQFCILKEGNYIINIKNPETPSPPQLRGAPKPQYPEDKQEEFRGYSWIPARDPSLLDQKGCQILLIGARPDIASDLGPKLHEHLEEAVDQALKAAEQLPGTYEEEKLAEKLLEDLRAEGHTIAIDPAVSGQWK
ncbi:g3023 [Coccomyxa elongata]